MTYCIDLLVFVLTSLWYRLSDPSEYQSIVDAEWNIIYDKLDKCVQTGAKIVLSRLAIGDLATQVMTSYIFYIYIYMFVLYGYVLLMDSPTHLTDCVELIF